MGKLFSKSTETPRGEETTILDKPWRDVKWDDSKRNCLKTSVKEYKPTIKSVPQARILLVGDVNAGKSSFFNSISSVFCGHITAQANAGPSAKSLTLEYRTYKVTEGRSGPPLSFLLGDTMGLEEYENKEEQEKENEGVHIKDIESILSGYIKDGYKFNPTKPWSQDGDQCHIPPLQERIHCVVFVLDASTLPLKNLKDNKDKKIIHIKEKANELRVPLMVLLTKVDKLCPNVEKNLQNMYRSKYLKEQIEKASHILGIQVSSVFPVKNYCSENELDMHCDILLLTAMQKMLQLADDFFANFQ